MLCGKVESSVADKVTLLRFPIFGKSAFGSNGRRYRIPSKFQLAIGFFLNGELWLHSQRSGDTFFRNSPVELSNDHGESLHWSVADCQHWILVFNHWAREANRISDSTQSSRPWNCYSFDATPFLWPNSGHRDATDLPGPVQWPLHWQQSFRFSTQQQYLPFVERIKSYNIGQW